MKPFKHTLPFSYILLGIIFFIIIALALTGIWFQYKTSESSIRGNAERLKAMDRSHIENSFRMIDAGLKLIDSSYNTQMADAFDVVIEEYNRSGYDPTRMDLQGLKQRIGGMDIHVINDRCVIQYSTSPADLGLDFAVIYPDFCAYLHRIWNTSGFYPDRVVTEWINGTLTKFGYFPAPDHHFIIELGMRSDTFLQERMTLQFSDVVNEVRALDPYIEEVLLFQKQKRLLYNTSYIPTPEESEMLDYVLWENRSSQVVFDRERGRTIVWQVVDLRDPDYAADMSIFAKITYNDALLAGELNNLRVFSAVFAGVVLLSGGIIAVGISRTLSRPIERLVADIDAIASGDLDHPVSHVPGYEFAVLEKSIRQMVERLKDDIRACEASERRFIDLVQLLPQGIFEANTQGTLTFANFDAYQSFQYTPQDLERGLTVFDVIIPEDRVRGKRNFGDVLTGKETEGTEYTGLRKDGSTFPILVYSAPIIQDEKVIGVRGTIVDLTRLKRIEEEIRKLNVELEQRVARRTLELEDTTKEMEAFTYSVSHDLRAPLRAIDGFSSILLRDAREHLSEGERRSLEVILSNTRHMDGLIDGLLTLSRLGRQELKREWVFPEPIVRQILSELKEASPGRTLEPILGDLPQCYADPVMLRQVYANLISNAVKFTKTREQAKIEIGAMVKGTQTVYFIRDNGIGFDMQYHDKLFKPFQRLQSSIEYEGSGVGLAIVHRILRRHGGTIWAEGEEGRGATFYFTLGTEVEPEP